MEEGLLQRIDEHSRRQPNRIAIREHRPDGLGVLSLTWAALGLEIAREAARADETLPPGALVILTGANRAAFVNRYLGLLASGRSVFPLHPALTRSEIMQARVATVALEFVRRFLAAS